MSGTRVTKIFSKTHCPQDTQGHRRHTSNA